jgi:formamidopyrimidine-DNA glycosylase
MERINTLALPTLTPEQRADALAKAALARKARSELLASIKSGQESIDKVLKKAKEDKTIGKTKVTQLLKAVPGLGAVKVAALLEQAGIDPDRRAAGLGERQREALLDALK